MTYPDMACHSQLRTSKEKRGGWKSEIPERRLGETGVVAFRSIEIFPSHPSREASLARILDLATTVQVVTAN